MADDVRKAWDAARLPPIPDGWTLNTPQQDPNSKLPPIPEGFTLQTGDPVADAKAARNAYYSSGIYAGRDNPLGPVANAIDAGASAAQSGAALGLGPAIQGAVANATGNASSFDQGRKDALATSQAMREQNPNASAVGDIGGMAIAARSLPQVPGPATGAAVGNGIAGGLTGAGYAGANAVGQNISETGHLPNSFDELRDAAMKTGVGMITGAAGGMVGAINQRPRLSPHASRQIDTLNNEGIPVFSGQATNDPALLSREAAANGAQAAHEGQMSAFSTAVARRAGIDAPDGHIYGQDLTRAMRDTGDEMTRLATNYDITDPTILNNVFRRASQIANDHNSVFNASNANRSPVVDRAVLAIGRAAHSAVGGTGGGMSGTDWQKLSSNIGDAMSATPGAAKYLGKIRSALADAMEASIRNVNPTDAGAWRAVNTMYKNQLVVKNALEANNDAAMNRLISPKGLAMASKRIEGGTAKANQTSSYHDLAEAGVSMLKPMRPEQGGFQSGVRDLRSMLATGSMAGSLAAQVTGSPTVGTMIGSGAMFAPAVASTIYNKTGAALRSVPRLNPLSAQQGIGLGTQAGVATGNPIKRALGQ